MKSVRDVGGEVFAEMLRQSIHGSTIKHAISHGTALPVAKGNTAVKMKVHQPKLMDLESQ